MASLPEISHDDDNADDKSNSWSDWGIAKGRALISLKQMEYSMKQFDNRMVQPNYSAFKM